MQIHLNGKKAMLDGMKQTVRMAFGLATKPSSTHIRMSLSPKGRLIRSAFLRHCRRTFHRLITDAIVVVDVHCALPNRHESALKVHLIRALTTGIDICISMISLRCRMGSWMRDRMRRWFVGLWMRWLGLIIIVVVAFLVPFARVALATGAVGSFFTMASIFSFSIVVPN